MTGFSTLSYEQRWEHMGDDAEQAFERTMQHLGHKFERFGFNRTEISLANLNSELRYSPDYVLESGALVEVMAVGYDKILKLKVEKLVALQFWCNAQPTWLYLYNFPDQTYAHIKIPNLTEHINTHGKFRTFSDGKPAWYVNIAELEIPWLALPSPMTSTVPNR